MSDAIASEKLLALIGSDGGHDGGKMEAFVNAVIEVGGGCNDK